MHAAHGYAHAGSRFCRYVVPVMAFVVVAGGCASGTKLPPDVIQAGQLDIQLPAGWKVTHDGAIAPPQPSSGSRAAGIAGPTTTIPLNQQNPTSEFFQATSAFTSCLKGMGVSFVGAPDPSHPNSAANSPDYLKALETCAAQSHIEQALQDFQKSQNDLTPAQIQQENQEYLRWRTCMIGRGWTIPVPKPDSQGRLFSLNTGGGGAQIVPPPGENVLTSPDLQACASQSQLGSPSGQG